jgi:hypothetical protein
MCIPYYFVFYYILSLIERNLATKGYHRKSLLFLSLSYVFLSHGVPYPLKFSHGR